jgi:hypothetical protein
MLGIVHLPELAGPQLPVELMCYVAGWHAEIQGSLHPSPPLCFHLHALDAAHVSACQGGRKPPATSMHTTLLAEMVVGSCGIQQGLYRCLHHAAQSFGNVCVV